MPIPYTKFLYIFPPRAETKIPYESSPVLDMWKGFPDAIAQLKLNGNRNVIYVSPTGEIQFWNRHKEKQKYSLSVSMAADIRAISPAGVWTVWDTELIHTKNKYVKDTIYFYDCLVWGSEYLIGKTYGERFAHVTDALGERLLPYEMKDMTDNLYAARSLSVSEWDAMAAKVRINERMTSEDIYEGLVFKRTGNVSRLAVGFAEINNAGFMCKARKPTKNSQF